MTTHDYVPGEWPTCIEDGDYRRLVALARRWLIGYEHLAEDAVTQAIIRWRRLPSDNQGIARLEQVIKSEAHSARRAYQRAHRRDERFTSDPTNLVHLSRGSANQLDLLTIRLAIIQTCKKEQIELRDLDIQVIELLFSGHSMAETERITGMTRESVRGSRRRWREVLTLVLRDHGE